MHRPSLVIVTPSLADANNGNWQTARRWRRLLAGAYRADLATAWRGGDEAGMIALHARKSAASVLDWHAAHPTRPLVLVLTGTDLYRDIDEHAEARRTLALADRIVVLNELGAKRLPPALRDRCRVVLQSCGARQAQGRRDGRLRVLMVGHLRHEKDPQTYWRAVERLAGRADIAFEHIGAALDPALGAQADALARRCPRFRWLGSLPHEAVRRRIQAAHVLVHASRMEGGANVVIEAVRSGTPVIASRIDGNLGLLGADHPAAFDPGDDAALSHLIERARDDPAMLPDLRRRAAMLAPRFAPEAERAALMRLLAELFDDPREPTHERP